ncbi:lysophospholipid acyltransferase family protein [Neisseria sp. Ec49-e6-T10]|uniref:lysophospholipid acyltransferase family protein n=1 Tax=Neisseria sp. Ec49-e6-T10 TaxID=3140744 RepID=UPI003EBA93C4
MDTINRSPTLLVKKAESSWLNKIWRITATGFCFAFFGIGGLILSALWFPLLRLCIKNELKCHAMTQNSIKNTFRFFIKLMQTLGILDIHFIHLEKLDEDSGCIMVANHPSLLDYVFLASVMPRCDCIVKETLLDNFFMSGVIKAAGYIPNTQADILLPACQKKLNESGTILIFPEGTRTTPGQSIQLQRGAANIALRSKVDIRIARIHCDLPMLTKQGKWYNIPPAKPTFTISIDEKIHIHDFISDGDEALAADARRLTQYLQQKLSEHNLLISKESDNDITQ